MAPRQGFVSHAWSQAAEWTESLVRRPGGYWPTRSVRRRTAWSVVMIAYLGTFGIGLFGVAKVWAGYQRPPRANWWQTGSEVIGSFTGAMMICLATGLTVRWLHGRNPYQRAAARVEIVAAAMFLFSMAAGFFLMAFAGWATGTYRGFPGTISNAQDLTAQLSSSLTAGFLEEGLFTLLIPVALIASGQRFIAAAAVSAALRWAFHLYYGWPSPALLVWAFAAVVIVWHMKAIWGVMIIHSLWDLIQTVGSSSTILGGWAIVGEMATLVLMFSVVGVLGYHFRRS